MQTTLFSTPENLLPFGGLVRYFPAFFSKSESDTFLKALMEEIDWKQEPIKIFGQEVMQPRLTAWVGDADKSYSYSGITMQPQPWTEALRSIKEKIEPVANIKFSNALLNYYRHGHDHMGWHRDNEKMLGTNPVVGSVSLGATRTFQLRHYASKQHLQSIELTHGSFLLMAEETQHLWEHRIKKQTTQTQARINLTFRVIR